MLKFYWNGIKEDGGKLQRCFYSDGQLVNYPAGTISIYFRDWSRSAGEVTKAFTVENNTDSQTDYFEQDMTRVTPDHPLYPQVSAANAAQIAHRNKRYAKYEAKRTRKPSIVDAINSLSGT